MIHIPMSPDYSKNAKKVKGDTYPCVVCGKPCPRPQYMLHLWDGTHAVLEEETATLNPMADLGMYPVGSDCLRKNPELKPYAVRQ